LRGFGVLDFAFGDELDAVRRLGPEKETTDGHVSRIHRALKYGALERREAVWRV
jgi:hypothetical protein